MSKNIAEVTDAAPILCRVSLQVLFHPDNPAFFPPVITNRSRWPTLPASSGADLAAHVLNKTAAPGTDTPASIRRGENNSNHAQPTDSPNAIPRLPDNSGIYVTSAVSAGESYGKSEYVKSLKTNLTISSNTPKLKGHILELEQMNKGVGYKLSDITQPTELFTQIYKINPTDIANDGTTPSKTH